jgi:hypothetical protein
MQPRGILSTVARDHARDVLSEKADSMPRAPFERASGFTKFSSSDA